ncbi:MAG TPA: thioredoxin domain-containing protein [Planctomycetota bacterium]|nr:thioredoxin domain-containing protein [Planctomycetota bacterium]
MSRIAFASLLALCCAPLLACGGPARSVGTPPFQALTIEEALKRAKAQNKVVFLDLYATWCGPCKMLDETTWKDAEVKRWLGEHAVAIKIDADKNRDVAERFELHAFPTLVFTWHTGAEIGRMVGYRDPQSFLEEARKLVEKDRGN